MNDTLPALHDTFLPDLPSSLERRIVHLLEQKMPAVLLTITQTTGHAARKAGTRALFTGQTLEGTLGGGLFEKRVIEEATQCFAKKESCLF
ncbi:MAG: XdhC family protein, partial [Desulfovibrio sp.]|nr:XdhC family protein [Desulfovibrio sp.]MBR4742187.1 XdhC family protein [Desulfovibrio sp.]